MVKECNLLFRLLRYLQPELPLHQKLLRPMPMAPHSACINLDNSATKTILLLSLFIQPIALAQTSYESVQLTVLKVVMNSVKESAKKRNMLIDPRIVQQIESDVALFSGNFCYSQDDQSECMSYIRKTQEINQISDQFIDELIGLPTGNIQYLADRLARGSLHLAGWPSETRYDVGLVKIPSELRKSTFFLRTAAGEMLIGTDATALLMYPGRADIVVKTDDGNKVSTLYVAANKSISLSGGGLVGVKSSGGLLQPSLDLLCGDAPTPPSDGPYASFNIGRSTLAESKQVRLKNEAPYVNQAFVNVEVDVDSGVDCSANCRAALAALFAESFATWRLGCSRCDKNALSVVVALGNVWVDWRLSGRLEKYRDNTSFDLNEVADNEGGNSPRITHYVNITGNQAVQQLVCKLDDQDATWLPGVKGVLCGDNKQAKVGGLAPRVTLLNGETACGPGATACGLPSERVEINMQDYRYEIPTNQSGRSIVVGTSNLDAPLLDMRIILLHEIGHWFGVPHAEVGESKAFLDVMAGRYGDGEKCVSAHSMKMMSNSGDLRWRYRINSGGGALLGPVNHASRGN